MVSVKIEKKEIKEKGNGSFENYFKNTVYEIINRYSSLREICTYRYLGILYEEIKSFIEQNKNLTTLETEKRNFQLMEMGEEIYNKLYYLTKVLISLKVDYQEEKEKKYKERIISDIDKILSKYSDIDIVGNKKEKILKMIDKYISNIIKEILNDKMVNYKYKTQYYRYATLIVEKIYQMTYNPYKFQVFIFHLKEKIKNELIS